MEILSIHIPKTAGTSFYQVLREVYGEQVSPSMRRRDVAALLDDRGSLDRAFSPSISVLHGHFLYREVADLHQRHGARVICWLRHPVARLISNWQFFLDRLHHPELNPELARLNRHRIGEPLLTYARLPENRDRISLFLEGLDLADCSFIGFQEHFDEDLQRLGQLLGWPAVTLPRLNEARQPLSVSQAEWSELEALNELDMALYHRALAMRGQHHPQVNGDA